MQSETIFRILLPVLIFAFVAHRGYYVRYHSKSEDETMKKREEGIVSKVAGLLGMAGFVSMILYVVNPKWLAFAGLSLPLWLRWTGAGIALAGFALLQWAQSTLADSWSDTPRMMKEQSLITSGVYQYVRHPIYSAFILTLGSTLLISSNWLIGLCWLGMTVMEVISRIEFEEALMIEFFGEPYREYMNKTGRLFPKV